MKPSGQRASDARERASAYRAAAECLTDPVMQAECRSHAEQYEQLARKLERAEARRAALS